MVTALAGRSVGEGGLVLSAEALVAAGAAEVAALSGEWPDVPVLRRSHLRQVMLRPSAESSEDWLETAPDVGDGVFDARGSFGVGVAAQQPVPLELT